MAPKIKPQKRPLENNQKITNPFRKGGNQLRDKATIKRLALYKRKPIRDKDGTLIRGDFMGTKFDNSEPCRIAPNRKWFENTHIIDQKKLEIFREEMDNVKNEPHKVVLYQSSVPFSLLSEPSSSHSINILTTESYEKTFGKKKQRKRPKISSVDYKSLHTECKEKVNQFHNLNQNSTDINELKDYANTTVFQKGQSKRIWNEVYKVIDSSDVIVEVLDARDPLGTRCHHIENYISNKLKHKHLVFILNKVDLIPAWCTKKWLSILDKIYPTIAFHASISKPFGKGSLINLLRQFFTLHKEKKNISIGFIGYPNVGKSSIINTLRHKKVCKSAPIPGETKVWQYINLTNDIFLIDCPGVVFEVGDDESQKIRKGVVRIDKVSEPECYIADILSIVSPSIISSHYNIDHYQDHIDFLSQLALKTGRMLKGAEPDITAVSKIVLFDFQKGTLPWYIPPPGSDNEAKREPLKGDIQLDTISESNDNETQSKSTEICSEIISQNPSNKKKKKNPKKIFKREGKKYPELTHKRKRLCK